jgi:hypothetical protein
MEKRSRRGPRKKNPISRAAQGTPNPPLSSRPTPPPRWQGLCPSDGWPSRRFVSPSTTAVVAIVTPSSTFAGRTKRSPSASPPFTALFTPAPRRAKKLLAMVAGAETMTASSQSRPWIALDPSISQTGVCELPAFPSASRMLLFATARNTPALGAPKESLPAPSGEKTLSRRRRPLPLVRQKRAGTMSGLARRSLSSIGRATDS